MYFKENTSWLLKYSLIALLTIIFGIISSFAIQSLDKFCENILPRIWVSIIVVLILWLIFIFLSNISLRKELLGKTKRCLTIKHLSQLSKLNEHINKANTIAMNYGSNYETIEELTILKIIKPYDKINYRINFWVFECLSKNPDILDYKK